MGAILVEYWRGLEALRPLIYESDNYKTLDPEAFYLGDNSIIRSTSDTICPIELYPSDKKCVKTYDGPNLDPLTRDLFVGKHQGILYDSYDIYE
jgi:hypothetical protein